MECWKAGDYVLDREGKQKKITYVLQNFQRPGDIFYEINDSYLVNEEGFFKDSKNPHKKDIISIIQSHEEESELESLERIIQSEGLKFDDNKPVFSSLPPIGLTELGKTQSLGDKKYEKHNWRKGIEVCRLLDAGFRHLIAASSGQDYDEEGNNHLAACAWNCLVAIQMISDRPDLDNRYQRSSLTNSKDR